MGSALCGAADTSVLAARTPSITSEQWLSSPNVSNPLAFFHWGGRVVWTGLKLVAFLVLSCKCTN